MGSIPAAGGGGQQPGGGPGWGRTAGACGKTLRTARQVSGRRCLPVPGGRGGVCARPARDAAVTSAAAPDALGSGVEGRKSGSRTVPGLQPGPCGRGVCLWPRLVALRAPAPLPAVPSSLSMSPRLLCPLRRAPRRAIRVGVPLHCEQPARLLGYLAPTARLFLQPQCYLCFSDPVELLSEPDVIMHPKEFWKL